LLTPITTTRNEMCGKRERGEEKERTKRVMDY